ncbi:MAG: hypothetical protein LBG09_02280 [Puniceicoccales bacterium]|jgi:hypothetical protein|nr:hypothetical protein [Puniceicoccales bacterium]
MNRGFSGFVFWVILLCCHFCAGTADAPPLAPENDVPKALLPALDPVATGSYGEIILFSTIAIILLGLALLLFFRYRRRQPKAPPLSSFRRFLRDLHRAKLHVYTRDTKEFCSALCFALKSYVQREYQLPITCRTTEEFLRLVNQSTKFSWEIANDLGTVLQSSDQAKFAGENFHQDFHKDLFLKTCRFAREVRRIRAPKKMVTPSVPKQ